LTLITQRRRQNQPLTKFPHILSCLTNAERCNAVSFLASISLLRSLLEKDLNEVSVSKASITAGDIIAQMSVQTASASHTFIRAFCGKGSQQTRHSIEIQRIATAQEDAALQMKFAAFRVATKPSQQLRLVSERAFVVVLNTAEMPTIVRLAEPVYISLIEITIPPTSARLPPSSLTVRGGPYANRTFTIMEDLTLVGDITLRFSPQENGHYCHACRANRLCLVRFLLLEFHAPLKQFAISGIRVFELFLARRVPDAVDRVPASLREG
jgi:hypothetical protein